MWLVKTRHEGERGRQRRAPGYPGWEVNPFSPGIPLGLNHPRKRRYCAAAEGVDYLTDRPNTCCSRGAPPGGEYFAGYVCTLEDVSCGFMDGYTCSAVMTSLTNDRNTKSTILHLTVE